ncbi:MAG TPA: hypothetical protein VIM68_02330, partial [Thermoanaerobaculia bacterium]
MTRKVSLPTLFSAAIALVVFFAFRDATVAKAQVAPVPNDVVAVTRGSGQPAGFDRTISANNQKMISDGRQIFRYDTFGDEAFWGDTLKLHQAIAGSQNGGVGGGVSPKTALAVGLKVDADALPPAVVQGVKS